jgi:hypothetical protein
MERRAAAIQLLMLSLLALLLTMGAAGEGEGELQLLRTVYLADDRSDISISCRCVEGDVIAVEVLRLVTLHADLPADVHLHGRGTKVRQGLQTVQGGGAFRFRRLRLPGHVHFHQGCPEAAPLQPTSHGRLGV